MEDMVSVACVPLGPSTQRSDLARLKHQRVQPSYPAHAKRHLLSHDQHFCAGMGVDLGSESALPEYLLMPVGWTAVSSLHPSLHTPTHRTLALLHLEAFG